MELLDAFGGGQLTVHDVLIGICTILLFGVAVQDLVARTVSNRSTFALALLGLALRALDGTVLSAVAISSVVFLGALACWYRGWLGGGDVKLLGAVLLLVPPPLQATVLVLMSIAGGVISAVYLATRHWLHIAPGPRPHRFISRALRVELWRLGRGGPVPYAIAIATGALGALASEGLTQ